jgi:hypothetical protein
MSRRKFGAIVVIIFLHLNCGKNSSNGNSPPATPNFYSTDTKLNGQTTAAANYNVNLTPVIKFTFSAALDKNSVTTAVFFKDKIGSTVAYSSSYENSDKTLIIQPSSPLNYLDEYSIFISNQLRSTQGGNLVSAITLTFATKIDSSRKFPLISDSALLTLIQQQTFKYFWDFGHPVSGMARERNTSGETVTTGGTGFGIMAIPVAVNRNFITRSDGLGRVQKIASFLRNTAPNFHGAFSHWMNGSTGAVVPFAENDDGADLVETSYMMMGLLTARQYFNSADAAEINLRKDIDSLWRAVDWDWFRQGGKNVLYWNWSPNFGWAVNVLIQGWNETLITYVMAASSPTHAIPKAVYDSGFSRSGAEKNGNSYYGYVLPLGEAYGGPLFFEHYSFLGINPNGLADTYANYQQQTLNHTKINYEYCKANPKHYFGYSDSCWGLTASDIENGYTASSPTNDLSVIAPTAAVSSIAYAPTESLKALKFFYYVLGDKLWGDYGFKDAFSLHNAWFANSYLAIDEGPIICMVENYRTGLLWGLFTSCPEIKAGLHSLGFTAPYL